MGRARPQGLGKNAYGGKLSTPCLLPAQLASLASHCSRVGVCLRASYKQLAGWLLAVQVEEVRAGHTSKNEMCNMYIMLYSQVSRAGVAGVPY